MDAWHYTEQQLRDMFVKRFGLRVTRLYRGSGLYVIAGGYLNNGQFVTRQLNF